MKSLRSICFAFLSVCLFEGCATGVMSNHPEYTNDPERRSGNIRPARLGGRPGWL
ncbi:hypothetical protein Bsp3421_002632 [Burkholderia sp. FERM BP-3421]|jgi:hypothetical protein|uniref:hypothetical protein n=1 Tax=Burkholderia sp. FERM BP-3421 TaxID=1494466 RepID=UPI00236119AA|nr:hypothetical protein [Burkholderia sp. FERM BP-3421]WDD92611.1 hypothetical protein Bsp3421_002632 [Burkholderia sp. FERM BP-3421]